MLFLAASALACLALLAILSGGRIAAFAADESCFALTLELAAGFAVTCFAFGLATGDYSWVDRLWSIVPPLFAWLYAARGGFGARGLVAASLVTLWGIRLTGNFARRGGYSGTEDYRWSALRSRMPSPWIWQPFNAAFICAFQLFAISLFSSPLGRLAGGEGGAPLDPAFAATAFLPILFLAYELEADREQWEFHARKAACASGGAVDAETAQGFRSSGLFRLSRHPAYFGELGFWWSVFLLCAVGSGGLFHWSAAGAALLTALFVGSTRFTESLSSAKYPAYAAYRETTSAVVPWFPKPKARSAGAAS
jgi:steroid 5-alpha reductase family enzyme